MAASSESEKMTDRQYVSITMPGPWVEAIDGSRAATTSRSAWIREAVRQRMVREDIEF